MSAVTIESAASGTGKVDWPEVVRQQVTSLRYGVVQIVVHDSKVTQIEKTERVRLAINPALKPNPTCLLT